MPHSKDAAILSQDDRNETGINNSAVPTGLKIVMDPYPAADYDGDGKTDLAVYRPSTGIWYITNSSSGIVSYTIFGLSTGIPAPGDFDGDGKADVSVFRPSDGNWYRQNSSNGSFSAYQFGMNGDKPTQTSFMY